MKSLLVSFILFTSLSAFALVTLQNAIDAAGAGKVEVLKKYKIEKKDLNSQDDHGINPLMQAVATGQKEVVQYLLKQKLNLELKNDADDTALSMAIGNEQEEIALLLIKAGAKIDTLGGENKSSMAFMATSVNSQKILDVLIKKSPQQVNEKNKNGDTALHEAARYGTKAILQSLLKAGAKKDIKNNEGKTPLDLAKSLKNEDAIQLLAK